MLVADRGIVVLAKGDGLANTELAPMSADSLFEIGSISKAFTACGTLRLEMEGKLRVDAPIGLYLHDVPEHASGITVGHLLSHTSGVSNEGRFQEDTGPAMVKGMLALPLRFAPGTKMEYSNVGYFLLAAIIEQVSGKSYEAFIAEEVLAPAGMTGSRMVGIPPKDPRLVTTRVDARGGRKARASDQPYSMAWGYKGAGGVVSSARDMLAFDKALRGDQLLDETAKGRMFTAGLGEYGCGWYIGSGARGWRHEHSGGVWGYASQMIRHEDGTVIIVLTNGNNDPVGLAKKLEATVIPESSEAMKITLGAAGLLIDATGQPKMLDIEKTAGVRAKRSGGGAIVEMFDRQRPDQTHVRIEMTDPMARVLMAHIHNLSPQRQPAVEGSALCRLRVAWIPYTREQDGGIRLPESARVVVESRYHGLGENGQPVSDMRPTRIVLDEEHGFWPVIISMDEPIASRLADDLEAALK
ncbi:MAG: beta-lactamase family protein [Phycisphaerales bacterium]|nr:beta-lactamase family protein [Phycisphaerales bacterium]